METVQRLIDEGQDINYRDKNNWTPLHCCASVGQLEICEALLKKDTITVTGAPSPRPLTRAPCVHGLCVDVLCQWCQV